jgi:hypothetical protein
MRAVQKCVDSRSRRELQLRLDAEGARLRGQHIGHRIQPDNGCPVRSRAKRYAVYGDDLLESERRRGRQHKRKKGNEDTEGMHFDP